MIVRLTTAFAAAVLAATAAGAQDRDPDLDGAVFIEVMSQRGAECGLLRPWQAWTLDAQTAELMQAWSAERRAEAAARIAAQAAETPCDNAGLTGWIAAASAGFEREYLPPFLVVYRTLATEETPLTLFSSLSRIDDRAAAVAMIDAQFAALEASGARAEGGKTWPEFIARTETFASGFADQLRGAAPEDPRQTADAAASWIALSVIITELWLDEREAAEDE